jgi:hypothetical protein
VICNSYYRIPNSYFCNVNTLNKPLPPSHQHTFRSFVFVVSTRHTLHSVLNECSIHIFSQPLSANYCILGIENFLAGILRWKRDFTSILNSSRIARPLLFFALRSSMHLDFFYFLNRNYHKYFYLFIFKY